MIIKPKCDILIDQDRYIGSDSIGHRCWNDADYQVEGYFVCKECKRMMSEEPERITFGEGTVYLWENMTKNYEKLIKNKEN